MPNPINTAKNLAKFLESSKIKERLYHGTTATEKGKGTEALRNLKSSKEGALGSGVYMTPHPKFANEYAKASEMGDVYSGYVMPLHAQIKNPLILEGEGDPMIEALMKLGLSESKAANMVEKAYDQKGYIGKQVQSRAQNLGYDGLAQYRNGDLQEVVAYNPNAVKSAIGNQGDFDIYNPELSKAEGGKINPIKTPRQMLFEMSGILPGYANLGRVEKAADIGADIYKKITKAISDYTRKTGSPPSPEDVKALHDYARSLGKNKWTPQHDPETQARATHALATDPNLRATSPVVNERGITKNFNPETSPDEFLSRAMLGRGARGTMLRPKTMEISDPNVVESIERAQGAGRLDDLYPSQSVTPASDAIARTATGLENAALASGKVPMIDQIKVEFFQKNKRYPSEEELEMLISAYNPLRHQYGEKGASIISERPYTAKGMKEFKERARNEGIPEYALKYDRDMYPDYLKDELKLQQGEIPTLRPQKFDVGGMVLSPYEMQAEMITRGGEPSRLSMKDYLRAAKKGAGRAMNKLGQNKAVQFGGKVLERAMPPVGAAMTAMSAHDTGKRLSKGDYPGAAMSGAMTALDAASMMPLVGVIPGVASAGLGMLQEMYDEREAKHRPQYEYSEDRATPGYRSVMEGYK